MRGCVICVLGLVAAPLAAEQSTIVAGFVAANVSAADAENEVAFDIDGCVFEKTLVNLKYCTRTGKGEGDRTIITRIDLSEVQAVSTMLFRGKFRMGFELDFDGPGSGFILMDRALNGSEGALKRYAKRREAALEEAELRSGTSFSRCDGSPPHIQKDANISVISNAEPEGWRLLVDLARNCRAPKSVELKER